MLERIPIARLRRGEERVKRRFEVLLLADPALDRGELLGPLDSVADLARDLGISAGMAERGRQRAAAYTWAAAAGRLWELYRALAGERSSSSASR